MKSKKSRRNHDFHNDDHYDRYTPPGPDIISIDVLGTMQDEELIKRLDTMYDGRNAAFKNRRASVTPWEVEISYVRRELQLRRERRQAHDAYVKEVDAEHKASQQAEKYLPSADLDNTKFMFLN